MTTATGPDNSDAHPDEPRLIAYALGDLTGPDAQAVAHHLQTCRSCGRVQQDVAGLTALLAGAGTELTDRAAAPPSSVIESVLTQVLPPSRRGRLFALAAALLILVAGVGGVVGRLTAPGPAKQVAVEQVAVRSMVPGVTAEAGLIAHTWGVEVDLSVAGLQPGASYQVLLLKPSGIVVGAGGLVGTGAVRAHCHVNAAVLRDATSGLRVVDASGREVLTAAF